MTEANREKFINAVFGRYFKARKGFIEIRFLGKEGCKPPTFFPSAKDAVIGLNGIKGEAFIGVCPRKHCKGGKKKDICFVPALWVDVDYGQEGHKKPSVYKDRQEALKAINKFPIKPSIIVDTGHGFHCYWLLDEPYEIANLEHVEGILKGLSQQIGGDTAYDVSRVMRLPGTVNMKIPDKPRPVTIIILDQDKHYALSDFEQFHVPTSSSMASVELEGKLPTVSADNLFISDRMKELIKVGNKAQEYPSRSEANQAVITAMVAGAYSDLEIKAVFSNPEYMIGEKYQEKERNGDQYLAHSIGKARAQQNMSNPLAAQPKETKIEVIPKLPDNVWNIEIFRKYRDAMKESTEACDEFHFASFLSIAGIMLGRLVQYSYARPLYGNTYITLVGPSGTSRKSTAIFKATKILQEVSPSTKFMRSISSWEGLLKEIADPHSNVLVCLEEAATLFKKAKQEAVGNIIPNLTVAFDCPPFLHNPTKKDSIKLDGITMSILSASTYAWLEKNFSEADIFGGFGNRFMFFMGPSKPAMPFPQRPDHRLMEEVMSKLKDAQVGWSNLENDPEDQIITLDEAAKPLWAKFYTWHRSNKWESDLIAVLVERIPEHVLKIAMIISAIEKSLMISPATLEISISVGRYLVQCVEKIFGTYGKSETQKLEQKVLGRLSAGPMKRSALHQKIGGKTTAFELGRVLTSLNLMGLIEEKDKMVRRIL